MSDIAQMSFDYNTLAPDTREFVQQRADEIHGQLKRTAEGIIKIGQNLIAVKERMTHGQFLPWIQAEFAMSRQSADNFIHVAERFADKLPKISTLPVTVLYALAAPSTPDTIVQQVQSGDIPPTLDAIKEAKRAEQQARDELKRAEEAEQAARAEAQATQQKLFTLQSQSQLLVTQLSQQIENLNQQIATLSTPPVQIKEIEKHVIPPEVTAQMEKLQSDIAALTAQRDKLAEQREALYQRAEALGNELDAQRDANEARRQQELYESQIRLNWRRASEAFYKNTAQLLGQLPSPMDTQVFEPDDWTRLSQVKEIAHRFLRECEQINPQHTHMVIEAI